jgi:hypothetical protein
MDELAQQRLGGIAPDVLADVLKLSPLQRRRMVEQLLEIGACQRADDTVPIEVAMRAATDAQNS